VPSCQQKYQNVRLVRLQGTWFPRDFPRDFPRVLFLPSPLHQNHFWGSSIYETNQIQFTVGAECPRLPLFLVATVMITNSLWTMIASPKLDNPEEAPTNEIWVQNEKWCAFIHSALTTRSCCYTICKFCWRRVLSNQLTIARYCEILFRL